MMTTKRLTPGAAGLLALLLAGPAQGQDSRLTVLEPTVAEDINPDPDIVEVILKARATTFDFGTGNLVSVYAYNDVVPGPTIKARVGDRLIVHLVNKLPEDTTIHWHGLELPANMDGSHISQLTVPAGGTFTYDFPLLEPSLYWYHPHVRTNEQVEKGLYGALLVEDPVTDAMLGLPTRQHVLVLDDVLLDDAGQIADPFPLDPLENADLQLNGREGNVLLVNGHATRYEPSAMFLRGVPQRLRILNASNSRFMRLSMPGHTLYRIGGDQGLLAAPQAIPEIATVPDRLYPLARTMSDPDPDKGLVLTPAERADVVFTPNTRKDIRLEWHDLLRGRHVSYYDLSGNIRLGHDDEDGRQARRVLLKVPTAGGAPSGEWVPPAVLRSIPPIDMTGARMVMSMFGHSWPDGNGDVTFFAQMKNGNPLPFPMVTAADAPTLQVGDVALWEVHNMTAGIHNFHLHGFKFQHLETQWMDMDNPANNYTLPAAGPAEWMDTIQLPPRPGLKGQSRSITRLALVIDDTGREGQVEASGKTPTATTSGGWLFHCHILEHSAKGMMSFLQVIAP